MDSLNEITKWHPMSLQKWLREIEENDLLMVMAYLPDAISHVILENLPSRIRKLITESKDDYDHIPERTIDKAKERILEVANDLIYDGELSEPGEVEEAPEIPKKTVLPLELPTDTTADLIETLTLLSKYSQERGLSSLVKAMGKINDPFLKEALQLVIDGADSDFAEEILRNRVEAISYHRELLYSLIIEGIIGIQEGNSTWTLKTRLRSYLPPELGGESSLF